MPMHLFALTAETSDALTVWGFVAGVVGCAVGVIGFGYTIYQVRKVKAAAEAAEEAAAETLGEMRKTFRRYLAAAAHRYLAEARSCVENELWQLAALRVNDLADFLGQLPDPAGAAAQWPAKLRAFGQVFAAKHRNPKKPHSPRKWESLLKELHQLLDSVQAPFSDAR